MIKKTHQIFVSHSKVDKDLDFFHRGFSTTGIKGVFMEYEEMKKPAWESIRNNVRNSDSVFVLLSKEVNKIKHTQNWVAFEVGLACQANKNVWVFERQGAIIDFAVPYLNYYVLYNPNLEDNFTFIRSIIQSKGIVTDFGFQVNCINCGINYSLGTKVMDWLCPSCRKSLRWSKKPW